MITGLIFNAFRKALPAMSETERAALEAGTTWWEADLFSGSPNWEKLAALPAPRLTPEEQSFLDQEVPQACALVHDWPINHETFDMPAKAWQFIKDKGFLGMIIPKAYGGLGFSAYAHSQVIARLSTRSSPLAVSVMVPNSLGPAELLLHYGTETQKSHYLPRLARGEEIPAFALTSPWAGSDAASIPDIGVVCKGQWQGQEVLGMRVSWNKRYITLAPVCTVLGLAFRLVDPENLLGKGTDIGITCALVPRSHPGVEIGRRHIPLNTYFMNGPTQGADVFMPLDFIIGGPDRAGQGWRMLMECLSAGRAISLPSSNAGMSQLTARLVGGYARVRSQFKTPISRFEGIEEALGRIASDTYINDATRRFAALAIDLGEKPSVVSAIAKYHVTERTRRVVNDGMDIVGGKGICMGPGNIMGGIYAQIPVSITVEGANILTRSLILFGQGAIRCHPYLLQEMQAAQDPDTRNGQAAFGRAFWAHMGHLLKNGLRAVALGWTGARTAAPQAGAPAFIQRAQQRLTRWSAASAFLSDLTMLMLGGSLKRREMLSARLGDLLAYQFLASAVIKRHQDEGFPVESEPVVRHALQSLEADLAQAMRGIFDNHPLGPFSAVLRAILFPWGLTVKGPSDNLRQQAAQTLAQPSPVRDRLTTSVYLPVNEREAMGALEAALVATLQTEPLEAKLRQAEKAGRFEHLPALTLHNRVEAALSLGILTDFEAAQLKERDRLRDLVIHVDDFPFHIHSVGQQPRQEAA
jgi:acyl-CoA dehydrogenase